MLEPPPDPRTSGNSSEVHAKAPARQAGAFTHFTGRHDMTTPLRLVTDEDSIPSLQDIEQVEDTAEYVRMVRMRMDFLREDILNSLSYLSPETQARIRHNADQARVAAQAAFLE